MEKLKYRKDIDGLRAIAVIFVILYHLDENYLPGGFLGVDIFFVISGYLITKIISYEMHVGQFTFSGFYLRRIKRILPAFYAMVLLTVLCSAILYIPSDVISVSKSAFSTIFFISNMYFGKGLDYFSSSSDIQPLLHTWSLAVEEQYYFVWPVLLFLILKRIKKNTLILIMAFLTVSSFSLAEYMSSTIQLKSLSYYILPTRFGEMMIGSIASYITIKNEILERKISKYINFLGFVMVIMPAFLVSKDMVFPGYLALSSCLGTALIIIYNTQDTFLNKILSRDICVFLGKISFSLYLFHWPILAFLRYINLDSQLSVLYEITAIFITFLFSLIIYYYVEVPCRNLKLNFKNTLVSFYLLPSSCIIILSSFFYLNSGFIFNPRDENLTTYDNGIEICHNVNNSNCFIGKSENKVAFVGDSHAAHFAHFLDIYSKDNDLAFFLRSASSCPVFPSLSIDHINSLTMRSRCNNLRSEFNEIKKEYKTIIISQKWDEYLISKNNIDAIRLDLQILNDQGISVILLEQVPSYKFDVIRAYKFNVENPNNTEFLLANENLRLLASEYENIKVISFSEPFSLIKNGAYNGQLLYRDAHHLNVYGAKFLANYIRSNEVKLL
ncbi:acyltransferase family protein [Vibrio cholerae]